jgi:hypothetical protein
MRFFFEFCILCGLFVFPFICVRFGRDFPAPQFWSVSCAPDSFSFACSIRSGLVVLFCIACIVFRPPMVFPS